MRSLVTGAAGFIGSALVEALVARGEHVLAVDNFSLGTRDVVERWSVDSRVDFIEADLAKEQEAILRLAPLLSTEPLDSLWHLAANSNIRAGIEDASVDLNATFLTTTTALEIARRFNTPDFYFTSSSAVYGERSERIDEESRPLAPISNYGAMKLAGEAAVTNATAAFLSRGVILRLPNVVGPRPTHGLLFDLLGKLTLNPDELEVLGDGRQTKPYMHVDEVIQAMFFLRDRVPPHLKRPAVYNLGPEDDGVAASAVAQCLLEALCSSAKVSYRGGDRGWPGDIPCYRYATARLNRLGWRPALSSEEAVRLACTQLAAGVQSKRVERIAQCSL